MSYNGKFGLLFLSLFLLTIVSCKKEETLVNEASGTIKALSYNVAGLPDLLTDSSPEKYMIKVSPLLNEYDVVHVQEDFCYHDSLLAFNTHPHVTEPSPCVPDGDGLNTFSNYPILSFERIPWRSCDGFDCLTPKGFSYSKIELQKGVTIDFYNIHCNAGGSTEDKTARRDNLKQLIEYMNIHSTGEPIILMGDFNSRYTRTGDTIRVFKELGFKDVWVELLRNNDIPSLNDSKLDDCIPIATSMSCEPVDKIFYRSNEEMSINALRYQHGDDNRYYFDNDINLPLSDHDPLVVDFSYDFKRK